MSLFRAVKGIVLHGGAGTRLRPLTHTGPKQLIPIANKPVSQYAVEDMIACGIREIAFILGDVHPDKVKDYYGDGSKFGAKFAFIAQGEPLGIAHAVGLCKEFVGDSAFIVYLGDNLIKGGVKKYADEFFASSLDAMILLTAVQNPSQFGVARLGEDGQLVELLEKPKNPPSNLALTGIYLFRPAVFGAIKKLHPSWRNELEITDAIQTLLESGHKVDYRKVEGWWKDTGTPEDILDSNRLILDGITPKLEGIVEEIGSVQGRVALGRGSRIVKGAVVRGPCVIGNDTMIGPAVYVGPYTSIGNHVSFSRGEIEDSIVMDNCRIEIANRITSSIIGQHTSITTGQATSSGRLTLMVGENCEIRL
jgi:glucose-1-phosphate thymidylyltransferase